MRHLKLTLSLLLIVLGGLNLKASHIPMSNLTWTCDPSNPLCYNFIFTQVINCPSTNPTTMSGTYFTFSNSCGLANPTMGTMTQTGVSMDVAQTCATATSTCAGGTVPGAWLATYEAQVCFPADCDSWTIDYDLCCRDASTNTVSASSQSMHVQSVMNTATAPCNNGPAVTSSPIPYMCAGQNNTYCLTTADPDADSTYYSMTPPLGNTGLPITYAAGYSYTQPLQGFVLDPTTGCMTFNQATTGNFVAAVLIESYDANGNLISSIIHDYQFEVINCSNVPPTPPAGGITNVTGTGTQTGPSSLAMCYGEQICFDVVFTDPDPANVLTISTDGTTLLPGATFTQTGTNPATGTLCWTAQPGFTGNVVTFTVEDDACPIVGTTSFSVNFTINQGLYAGPDYTICAGETVQLQGTGGTTYNWTPGGTLSCTNCANPNASPTTTTQYILTGTVAGNCPVTPDTVTVTVDFPGTLDGWAIDSLLCPNESTQLDALLTLDNPPATGCVASTLACTGPSTNHTIGTGVDINAYPSPFQGFWHDGRMQMIIPATELLAAGVTAGNITQLTFDVNAVASTLGYNGFTIKMGCTSLTSYASASYLTGLTTVLGPIFYNPTPGVNTFLFTTPYLWDGVQNIVIETCFDNSAYTSHDAVFKTNVGYNAVCYDYTDGASGCTLNTPLLSMLRPNVTLSNCPVTFPNIYTYTWTPSTYLSNPNIANPTVNNLPATQTYVVTSFDPSNPVCSINDTVTIYVNDVDAGNDITICTGGTGQLNAVGTSECTTGGNYSWSPTTGLSNANIANPTVSVLNNTTYIVSWNDGCSGCTVTDTVEVFVVPPTPPTMTSTAETCVGLNDGTATATPNGMTAPIVYSWNTTPVQSTQTATGLAPGTYTVTVTDANNCTATNTVTVNPGIVVTAGFTPPANQCLTGNSFTFTNTGTTGVTYSWDFGDGSGTSTQENPTYSYSAAGTYTVTQIVSNAPCADTVTGTVTVYDMPLPTATADSVLCNGGATGSATVNTPVTPGPGPFSYSWNTTPVQTTNPASNLPAGTYTVTVTDQTTNCTGQATVTVFEPPLLTATETPVDPSCNGFNDGSATANPAGGTPGYSYSWNTVPVQTTQTATGLTAGTYTCTITDANGCQTTVTSTLIDPPGMVLDPTMTQANCGQPDGSATVNVIAGGTGPYTYSWNTAPVQTTQTASNIPAGTYIVTVVDQATGCSADTSIIVTSTTGITATATFISDALCNGSNDGTAYAFPTGGTPNYSYSWNTVPVQTNDTLVAGAGTYTVTITDANGCTGTDQVTINEPTPVVASITGSNDASCFGATDGDATAAGAGGTPNYTYSWNTVPVQTTQTATGLAPGTYEVIVSDANGCPDTTTVTILDGPAITSSIVGNDVSCFGGNDGSADLTVNGGTAPYTYNWTPSGSASEDPTGLSAGMHIVTVTSQEGCSVIDTVIINEPPALVAVIDSSFDVSCFGFNDGVAFGNASGGTTPYTYSWNTTPVQNTQNGLNLAFGSYTLTVTDSNGCTATANVNINQPPALAAVTGSIDAYCGLDQGSVWINPTNGTAPYIYTWDSAGTIVGNNDTVSGLYPGTYNVVLDDANGCKYNGTVTVNAAPGGIASISAFTDVSCNGGNDGTATVSVGGAFPGYSYQWDAAAGNQTTNPATGLAAGTYTVTVTDNLGCVMNTNVTINEPTPLTLVNAALNNNCPSGCAGSINATPGGGTAPYTFQWNDPALQITATAVGLCDGTYSVTVTDSLGCTIVDSALIDSPDSMVIGNNIVPANCNQSDGSAFAFVSQNGTAPFTYVWDDGAGNVLSNNDSLNNVPAGTYFVTVYDNFGCFVVDSVTVPNLLGPTMVLDSTYHVLCNGGTNGYAEVQVSGGTFPYTYSWNTTPVQTTPSASNLAAGTYTVTATDSNGCIVSTSVTITEPTALQLAAGGVDPTCFTYTDGTAWVNAFGGTTPYSYSWNTVPALTNDSIGGLGAGTYVATVVDSNGCFDTISVTLIDPLLFSVNVTGNNVSCNGVCDGTASTTLTNGIFPFTYAWDDPSLQTTDSVFGLCADTFNVVVTDNMGCIANGSVVITEPALLVVTENTHGDVSCNGGNDGFSSVNVVGGTGPYNYNWDLSGATVSTAQSANNLVAGSYLVTVTDANGCTDQINIIINEPNPLTANFTATDVDCFGANTGQAVVTASGGTAPYSYQWDDAALQQTDTAFNLVANTAPGYSVTVTDSLGCTFVINNIVINEPPQIVLNTTTVSSTCGNANGSANVNVGGGTPNYSYSWNTVPVQGTATANNVLAGSYTVTVTDANGCIDSASVNIIDLGSPTVTIPTHTDVSCNGANDGTAQSAVIGGTTPYTYAWNTNPVQTTPNATGLAGQTYSVTVTDSNGCIASASVTIQENTSLSAVINTSTNVSCNGLADGDANVIAAGGGAPYTYSWNTAPIQTTQTATGLIAGTYIVTATDTNGCTAMDTVTITEPAPLAVAQDSLSNVLCNGGNDGYVNVTVSGGTLGYSYAWTPIVSNGPTAAGVVAGSYTVTVTDANNCIDSATYVVTEPNQLVVDTVTIPSTCGNPNGSATVNITTQSTPGYTYLWNDPNNQTTATATGLTASNYVVTVTDANGCSVTQNVTVNDLPGPIIDSITTTPALCFGQNNGTATVYASGNGPFNYLWDDPFAQTNQQATGLSASPPIYTVVVTDANGCVSSSTAQITQPGVLSVNINSPDTVCYGEVVQIFANANQGTQPYNYLWNSGQTGQGPHFDTLTTSTSYTVDVQDVNGCQASDNKIIVVRAKPQFLVDDWTICQGEIATLTPYNITGGNPNNPFNFFWMEIDSVTNVLSPTGVPNPTNPLSVSPPDTTDYIVWVDDGCSAMDTVGVTVNVNDTAIGQLVPVQDTCQGFAQGFALTTVGGVTFGWDFDSDGTIDQTTTSTVTNYTYPASGTYDVTVTLTTAEGCVSQISENGWAVVNPNPVADFATDPTPPIVTLLDPTFDFIDQSFDANTWNWNFGDTNTDVVQHPTHTYQDTGFYDVQLIISNTFGCYDTIMKTVRVKPDFFFAIPNTFTPNGDGLNDFFHPGSLVGAIENDYKFFIFDRWGELIFEGHDLSDGWDGTYKGRLVQTGTYVWKIEVMDLEGTTHNYTGHVNIIK